jgi:hypothetical protein
MWSESYKSRLRVPVSLFVRRRFMQNSPRVRITGMGCRYCTTRVLLVKYLDKRGLRSEVSFNNESFRFDARRTTELERGFWFIIFRGGRKDTRRVVGGWWLVGVGWLVGLLFGGARWLDIVRRIGLFGCAGLGCSEDYGSTCVWTGGLQL